MHPFRSLFRFGICLTIASLQTMAQSVELPYKEVTVKNVDDIAVFSGTSTSGAPGQPALPSYIVSFLLPPNADPSSVSVSIEDPVYKDLDGQYTVVPVSPVNQEDGTVAWPAGAKIVDGKDMSVYGKKAFFPSDFKGNLSCSRMRQYNLAQIRINPILFNPVTKKLRKLLTGTLKVTISANSSAATNMSRSAWVEKMLKTVIVNPDDLNSYGPLPSNKALMRVSADASPAPMDAPTMAPVADQVSGFGYLIVSTNALWSNAKSGLDNYRQHLERNGAIVTRSDVAQSGTAQDRASAIRSAVSYWYYNTIDQGIEPKFVLLVGHPCPNSGSVPMWLADYTNDFDIATDFAYSNLGESWQSENTAWLCVGRIPVYDQDDIDSLGRYFQRMINYSTASGAEVEWRRNMLWAQIPLGAGKPSDEQYPLGDSIITYLHSKGWNYYRMYDPYPLYPYPSYFLIPAMVNANPLWENLYCNESYVANAWNSETPGVIFWHAHGGYNGSDRIISSTGTNPSVDQLIDSFPAMVYAASCGTMDPRHVDNCGKRTLFKNAISYVGATETVGYHKGGVGNNGDPVVSTREYYQNLGLLNMCAAEALNAMHLQQNSTNTQWTMLYGCPEAALNLSPVCETPVPQNFKATAVSKSEIVLSWDAYPGAVVYHIQRSEDFSTVAKRTGFTTIATIPAEGNPVQTYPDVNVTSGTKYKYRVSFQSYGFPSGYSKIDSAATWDNNDQPMTPGVPNGLGAIPGSNSAHLSWTAVAGEEISYSIKRSINNDGPFVTIINTNETSFLDSNLMNSTTYYYVVAAVNQYGQSDNSAPVSVTPATALAAPTLNSASSGSYNASCNYSTNVHNETGFIIQTALRLPDGTCSQYSDAAYPRRRTTSGSTKTLASNSTYALRVCAANETTYRPSDISIDITIPPSTINPVTVQPRKLTATSIGSNQITLNWEFSNSNTCDYTEVFYKAVGYDWMDTIIPYPQTSVTVEIYPSTGNQFFIRTVKKGITGEPDGALSCSDFTGISDLNPYEAENATLTGSAKTNTNHTGYSGTGFVDGYYYSNTAQTSFSINVPFAGVYDVTLHYSAGNGASSNTGLYVNGTLITVLNCPATPNWNTWADKTESVTLNAGNNTITYKAETSSNLCINLDYIVLINTGVWINYTITASAGANGSINPSGIITLKAGSDQSFDIVPNSDYQVDDVLVDGRSIGATSFHIFYDITADHTISATFKRGPCYGVQGGGGGLQGTAFGRSTPTTPEFEYCKATDGDLGTYYNYNQPDGGYTGLDLGTAKVIGKIRYYPVPWMGSQMTGGKFQGSNTSNNSGFVDLYTISGTPLEGWNEVTISSSTAYRWVRYRSPDGASCYLTEVEFYAPGSPSAPSNLVATAVAPNQINLAWNDNSNNETGFAIERSLSYDGPWNQVATVGTNVKAYYDAQLTGGTTYWYRVKAYSGTGSSGWSNSASATTPSGGYGNLAIGKTVTASSEIAGGTYSVAKVNDDNTSTRWTASDATFPQWVKVDLGSQRTISEVEMMFAFTGSSGDCYDFIVETSSDDNNWTTQVNQIPNWNTAQTQRYGFSPTSARYVRVTITGAPGTYRASLYEFRVFGM